MREEEEVIHINLDTWTDRQVDGLLDWLIDWFYVTKESFVPFQLVYCRAFLVAILNDARQKIVEIKFPVKKRVIIMCDNIYFRNAKLRQCFCQHFSRGGEEGGEGGGRLSIIGPSSVINIFLGGGGGLPAWLYMYVNSGRLLTWRGRGGEVNCNLWLRFLKLSKGNNKGLKSTSSVI